MSRVPDDLPERPTTNWLLVAVGLIGLVLGLALVWVGLGLLG